MAVKYYIYQRGGFFEGYVGPNGPTYNLDEAFAFEGREDAEKAKRSAEANPDAEASGISFRVEARDQC